MKLAGDGALAEFPSAVDALSAAIEFQQAMAEANRVQPEETQIVFRIGLHLGDLIVDGDDLYGDGVNVAARLEAEAPPGAIIVSGDVHNAVVGRLKATLHDLGVLPLKNIERPVQAYRAEWNSADWQAVASAVLASPVAPATQSDGVPLALPDKPSIAVLPFQNMSGDPDQEYFADGMVEDIITALSRTKALFVIARNSSFAYKGKSPDIRDVGRALGVRYVLEGSVRKAGNRLRVTGQLIDAANGAHIWADRIDGAVEDIFELQDTVTSSVVGAILPALEQAEIVRAKRKVGSLQAYDYYLRGLAPFYLLDEQNVGEAFALFEKAIEIDAQLALAYSGKLGCYIARKNFGWNSPSFRGLPEVETLAHRAISLDRSDARVLAYAGQAVRFVVGRQEEGSAYLDEAVNLDPNLAIAWAWRAGARTALGQAELAIKDLERALRLSPLDPLIFVAQGQMAKAHFLCRRYEEAKSWAAAALRQRPRHLNGLRILMAAQAMTGETHLAQEVYSRYRELDPSARSSGVGDWMQLRRDVDIKHFECALRLIGMPE